MHLKICANHETYLLLIDLQLVSHASNMATTIRLTEQVRGVYLREILKPWKAGLLPLLASANDVVLGLPLMLYICLNFVK